MRSQKPSRHRLERSLQRLAADDHCLEALYPPGSCGTFCNLHTYECYLTEIQESCCDEEGHVMLKPFLPDVPCADKQMLPVQNCEAGHDVPNTCQVGCAIV